MTKLMKKNKYSLSLSLKFLCRVILLTSFWTSFLCFSVKGDPVEPQRVTLELKDVSLSVLFQEIKKQTSFKFFYNDTQEKDMGKITISVKNETVENVLDRVFQGKEYTYRISGEQIIVVKRQETRKPIQEVVIEGLSWKGFDAYYRGPRRVTRNDNWCCNPNSER